MRATARVSTNRLGVARVRGARRGMGIAVVVVMLAIVNIAVLGAVAASGEEANLGAMRLETTRAFYAAESGAMVVVRQLREGVEAPQAGTSLSFASARVEFERVPRVGEGGEAIVIGTSGFARRRVVVTIGTP
jgi:hypothetical protein